MKKIAFIAVALVACIACGSLKLTQEEKEMRLRQVSENIERDEYTIEVNKMNPMRGKTISLTSGYDLTIRNDSAIAYLPYYGRVTYAPYGGGDGGIKFVQKMKNYQIGLNNKGDGWIIRFDINTPEYNYTFNVTVYNEGNSSINVTSNQREPISFSGEMKLSKPAL